MEYTTEDKIKILCLKSLNIFIHQIIPFKNLFKKFQKVVIEEWSSSDSIQIKLHAFIVKLYFIQKFRIFNNKLFLYKI